MYPVCTPATTPMARKIKLQVWINEIEQEKLEAEALRRQVSRSEVIQDFIKGLPSPDKK